MSFICDFERRGQSKKEQKLVLELMTQNAKEQDFQMKVEE